MSTKQGGHWACKATWSAAGVSLLLSSALLGAPRAEASECVEFSGLKHCALEGSSVSASPEGVTVSTPDGKSGGARIEVAGGRAWDAELLAVPLAAGARAHLTLKGQTQDGTELKLESLALEGRPELGPDVSALLVDTSVTAARTYTVRGYQAGVLVFEKQGVAPKAVNLISPTGPGSSGTWAMIGSYRSPFISMHGIWGDGGCTPSFDFPKPIPFDLRTDGVMDFVADLVTVTAEGVKKPFTSPSSVEVESIGVSTLSFTKSTTGGGKGLE